MGQIIIHVDMDAFFASVEIRDDPSLAGKPLIIGSLPTERGVVATCSYEARKYGVHSAMNIKEAYHLCPNGIYRRPDIAKYRQVSKQLHEIWESYSDAVQYVALDEAYLDVTETAGSFERAGEIARTIKERTLKEAGLTCSVGVAYSKTAAKTASEEKKPDGYFEIPDAKTFTDLISGRDIRVLYTVGARTAEKLNAIGIYRVRDIREHAGEVERLLGRQGRWIVSLAFGNDDRRVEPYRPEDARSISRELTFQEDVRDFELLKDVLFLLAVCVEDRLSHHRLHGQGVALKITYSDMRSVTRSRRIERCDDAVTIFREAASLLEQIEKRPVRLVGAGVYGLTGDENRQLCLEDIYENFRAPLKDDRKKLYDKLQDKYGLDFSGHAEMLLQGRVLYRTAEYMRKYLLRQRSREMTEKRPGGGRSIVQYKKTRAPLRGEAE